MKGIYSIDSTVGKRFWYADNIEHAIEQYHEAGFSDEKIVYVVLVNSGPDAEKQYQEGNYYGC